MTTITPTQIQTCKDAVSRMKQAQAQGKREEFDLQKERLAAVLEAIETVSPQTYAKYSSYLAMQYN